VDAPTRHAGETVTHPLFRWRTLAWRVAVWLALGAAAAFDALVPSPHAALQADFGVDVGRALVNFGALLLGIFGGRIDKAVKRALETMRDAIVKIVETLAAFAAQTGTLFARVAGLLRRFWTRALLPLLRRLDDWALRVQRWLRDTFGPILRFLLEVRRRLLEFYAKWFRPIFDTIDVIRRILGLLSVLHLDFARKLDQKLAELERRLRLPLEVVIRKINEAIDVVDAIIDANGFFRRLALIRSLVRYQKDALKVWWQSVHRPLAGVKREEYESPPRLRPIDAVATDYRQYVIEGGGPDAARIDEHARDYALRLGALTLDHRMLSGPVRV